MCCTGCERVVKDAILKLRGIKFNCNNLNETKKLFIPFIFLYAVFRVTSDFLSIVKNTGRNMSQSYIKTLIIQN